VNFCIYLFINIVSLNNRFVQITSCNSHVCKTLIINMIMVVLNNTNEAKAFYTNSWNNSLKACFKTLDRFFTTANPYTGIIQPKEKPCDSSFFSKFLLFLACHLIIFIISFYKSLTSASKISHDMKWHHNKRSKCYLTNMLDVDFKAFNYMRWITATMIWIFSIIVIWKVK